MTTTEISAADAEAMALFGLTSREHPMLRAATVACFFAFCFVAPALFLCGLTTRTRSSIPRPEPTRASVLDGRYMTSLETWLREESPLTYQMRGLWCEARFAFGLLDSVPVMIGSDGFLFSRGIVRSSRGSLLAGKEKRGQVLTELRARAQRLGVEVVAVPAPDAVSVYPENAPLSADVARVRAGCYDLVLEELRAHGFAALDVRAQFVAHKPHQLMCLRRDTHWTDAGALVAARMVVAHLLGPGVGPRVGPEVPLRGDLTQMLTVGDLLAQLGMRSNPGPTRPMSGAVRTWEVTVDSALVGSLRENHVAWNVMVVAPEHLGRPGAGYEDVMRQANVALCGDSYANRSFKWRVALELNRLVDWSWVHEDAVAWRTIDQCLRDIEAGVSRAKVVVWEFAERKFSQDL